MSRLCVDFSQLFTWLQMIISEEITGNFGYAAMFETLKIHIKFHWKAAKNCHAKAMRKKKKKKKSQPQTPSSQTLSTSAPLLFL